MRDPGLDNSYVVVIVVVGADPEGVVRPGFGNQSGAPDRVPLSSFVDLLVTF